MYEAEQEKKCLLHQMSNVSRVSELSDIERRYILQL